MMVQKLHISLPQVPYIHDHDLVTTHESGTRTGTNSHVLFSLSQSTQVYPSLYKSIQSEARNHP